MTGPVVTIHTIGFTQKNAARFFGLLQVNGIYSFPDWLGGRCFADFAGLPG